MSDEYARDAQGRILRDRYGRPVRRRGQSGADAPQPRQQRAPRPSDEVRRRAAQRRQARAAGAETPRGSGTLRGGAVPRPGDGGSSGGGGYPPRRPAASGYDSAPVRPRPRRVSPPQPGAGSTRMYPAAGSGADTPRGDSPRRREGAPGAEQAYRRPTPHYSSSASARPHAARPGDYLPGYEDAPIDPAYRTPASYERRQVPPAYQQPAYQQPPAHSDPNAGRAHSPARRGVGAGWLWKLLRPRGCMRSLALLVVVLVLSIIGLGVWADGHISRVAYQPPVRVAGSGGTNWLLVGSDSRQGLSEEDVQRLGTGGDIGSSRTDTIMVLHLPLAGKPTLLSIPRDSYVQVPGYGMEKINASFAEGGAPLLVQTVEQSTGLHIDHYAEIGFGGFAAMVDAVGGLELCPKEAIDDPLAHLNVQPGCQQMDGPTALGFVRTRATAMGDLDRVERQREFFTALVHKMTSGSTLANPWRDIQLTRALVNTLTIGEGDHVWSLLRVAVAAAGGVDTMTVPVGGFQDTEVGNVVVWDEPAATNLFHELGAKN